MSVKIDDVVREAQIKAVMHDWGLDRQYATWLVNARQGLPFGDDIDDEAPL